jgi:hypothetical protein
MEPSKAQDPEAETVASPNKRGDGPSPLDMNSSSGPAVF